MSITSSSNHRIRQALVIDDDEFMCDLVHEMLANLQIINVRVAHNGATALELLSNPDSPAVDILVCDLAMPGMDGIEFLRHLARQKFRGGVILLSGTSTRILHSAEQLGRAHGLQLLGILEKPVSLPALGKVLTRFEAQREVLTIDTKIQKLSEAEIREGLRHGRLVIHFQPKISTTSRQLVGIECLARWQDPVRGLLPPSAFIETAEETGLIGAITESVFRQATRQSSQWRQGGHPMRVSINISMDDVGHLDLPERLSAWAEEFDVPNDSMVLELTESRLMTNQKVNLDIITRLRLKGFGLSIDDFGTGYSTLEKLKNLPFTELKIDKAFVHGVVQDSASRAILESSALLGKALGLCLVAEGVETQEDWDAVASLGIDEVQGYFISRPLPAAELLDWKIGWEKKTVVDLNRLYDLVGNKPAAHLRLLEQFLVAARQGLAEIDQARAQGDCTALGAVGHRLKSSARSLGAHLLADACEALEVAGNAGDLPKCIRLTHDISRHFAPVATHIEEHMKTLR